MILNTQLATITVCGTELSVYKWQLFHFCCDGDSDEEKEEEKHGDDADEGDG